MDDACMDVTPAGAQLFLFTDAYSVVYVCANGVFMFGYAGNSFTAVTFPTGAPSLLCFVLLTLAVCGQPTARWWHRSGRI